MSKSSVEMEWYERVGEARVGNSSSFLQVVHSLSYLRGDACGIV